MSGASRLDDSTLSVLLDVRHPLAYLALGPAAELGRELGLEINWLPLRVSTLRAPSHPAPGDDRGILHRRARAQAIAREIEIYAASQGLVLRDYYRDAEAPAVELGWLFMREHAGGGLEAYLHEVFRAYWRVELDPADNEAVAKIVQSSDGNAADFLDWAAQDGPAIAEALAVELAGRGLSGVPGYLLNGEFFLGRQHLSMIRWRLQGQPGRGPI